MLTCHSCALDMALRPYQHKTTLQGKTVLDGWRMAPTCPNQLCGEVSISSSQLREYEQRACLAVLLWDREDNDELANFTRKAFGWPKDWRRDIVVIPKAALG